MPLAREVSRRCGSQNRCSRGSCTLLVSKDKSVSARNYYCYKIRIKLLVSTPALKLSGYSVHPFYSKSVCRRILPIRFCEGSLQPHAYGLLPPELYRYSNAILTKIVTGFGGSLAILLLASLARLSRIGKFIHSLIIL